MTIDDLFAFLWVRRAKQLFRRQDALSKKSAGGKP